jgi:hypothetical protein
LIYLAAWILLPLLVLLSAGGTGLLVERATRWTAPAGLTAPVGLAAVLLVLAVPYGLGFGAEVALAVLVAVTAAGLFLGRSRLKLVLADRWTAMSVLAVYGLYLAPVAFSGEATFAGYTFLGDNSVHFALMDHLAEDGTTRVERPPSSYAVVTDIHLANGYPLGLHYLLATLRLPLGQDVAWLYQPFLASTIGLGALPAAEILRRSGFSRWLAGAAAVVAVGAYLPFSYSLQGGLKELAMVTLVLTAAVLARDFFRAEHPRRTAVVLGLLFGGAYSIYSVGALPWFAVMIGVVVLATAWRERARLRPLAVAIAILGATFVVVTLPTLAANLKFFGQGSRLLTSSEGSDVGNLIGPLRDWQIFGIWFVDDYRLGAPDRPELTFALVGVAAVLLGFGVVAAFRGAGREAALTLLAALAVWVLVPAGIYIEGKLMAILSPAVLLGCFLGAVALARSRHRIEAVVLALAVSAGVLVSDAMAYHGLYLAPKDRLEELATINDRFEGQGPALLPEFEEYGKHFLRDVAVNTAYEAYTPAAAVPRLEQQTYNRWLDIDELRLDFVQRYPLIIQRRSAVASRPPAGYRLAYDGRYYRVWRRNGPPQVTRHIPLGDHADPTGRLSCARAEALGERAEATGQQLLAVERPAPIAVPIREMALPAAWPIIPDGRVVAIGPGRAIAELRAPEAGRYRIWLRGTFGRGVDVLVDGRRVGHASDVQTPEGMALVGEVTLREGAHELQLLRGGGSLAPGNGRDEAYETLFVQPIEDPTLMEVDPDEAGELCRERLDWVALAER